MQSFIARSRDTLNKQVLLQAATGLLIGSVFPLLATVLEGSLQGVQKNFSSLVEVQLSTPMLWIINLFPVLFGLFAGYVAINKSQNQEAVSFLEIELEIKEQALKLSEDYLRNILQSMADLMLILDVEGKIQDINISTLKTLGLERADLVGKSAAIIFGKSELNRIVPDSPDKLFETGFYQTIECKYSTSYSTEVYLNVSLSYIWDDFGQPTGIICIAQDITERKHREDLLVKSRLAYESLFNDSPIPIAVLQNQKIIFENQEVLRLFERSSTEIRQSSVHELFHEADRDTVRGWYRAINDLHRDPSIPAVKIDLPGDTERWVEIRSTTITWQSNPAILCFLIDISESYRMERALMESEKQYRDLVQLMNVIIMKADSDFNFTFMNRFGQEFFGYTEEELIGKNILETITPRTDEDGRDLAGMVDRIIKDPTDFSVNENENVHRDGRKMWVGWRNKPIYDHTGKLVEIISTGIDITDRVLAEKDVKKKTTALQEKVKELNCLYGFSELIENHGSSLRQVLQGGINLIPESFQLPEKTCARLILGEHEYHTRNFKQSDWFISETIFENRIPCGDLQVFYVGDPPPSDASPFLPEEVHLLKALAQRIGRTLEKYTLEAELIESETRYKTLISSAPIPLIVTQNDKFVFMNPEVENLFEYSEEELKSLPFIEFLHPADREKVLSIYQKRIERCESSQNYTYRILTKSGKTKSVEVIAVPYTWEREPATLSFHRDITERLAADRLIKFQNDELRSIHNQMNSELEQAKLAQLTLLPNSVPSIPGITLATKYNPVTQLGGDFYDLHTNKSEQCGILVGDVTGHGIPAALLSFLFMTTFKSYKRNGNSPSDAIDFSNRFLSGKLPKGKYATLFYCIFDNRSKKLHYSCAGHPPGILIRPSTGTIHHLQTTGMVVGMFETPLLPFESKEIELVPGDKVIIYTDGIVEITDRNNEMFNTNNLDKYLSSNASLPIQALIDGMYDYCLEAAGKRGFNDDVTMVGFEVD